MINIGARTESVALNTRCIGIFNFIVENPEKLNLNDQEELELIGEGDDEGWVKARNYKGEVGYVPRSYLEVICKKVQRITKAPTILINFFKPKTEEPYQIR